MGNAHSVITHGFQNLDFPLLCPGPGGAAQEAMVMVNTAALQLQRLSVQPQAMLRIHFIAPDAENRFVRFVLLTRYCYTNLQRIQIRRFR